MDFNKIKTISLSKRKNKFNLENIISLSDPIILSNNKNLIELSEKITQARKNNKQFIFMMGAHAIKLGLSLFIIDLMKRDIITHIAVNGAVPIHDFEIAYIGATSEDVLENLKDGSFGMAEETGHYLNLAAKKASKKNLGLGYSIGKLISDMNLKYKEFSLFYHSYKLNIPLTVHTAIGAEIIYEHPECDAGALGSSSYNDFKILTDSISKLKQGVVVNLGSAVIMPEVFLKSFSITRNLGFNVEKFTAANLDKIDHYRPRKNVVERPTYFKGKGLTIIENHEKSIPTLYRLLLN